MRTCLLMLAAAAALIVSPVAAHSATSSQQELTSTTDGTIASYGGLERFARNNRALLQTQVRGEGDEEEEMAPASPAAGFGTTMSINASKAFEEAQGNPIFMNFTAVRSELASMEGAFGDLERQAIDALTIAESKAVAAEEAAMVAKSHKVEGVETANAAAALANAFKTEVGQLHEQESVLRYLRGLSAEAARINATATAATKAAAAKQSTRNALRSDAEAAAGGYLGYNMAASSLSYEAVASFLSQAAGAQRAAEKWRAEAELRALHAVALHLARLKAAAEGVGSTKDSLKGLYGVAGAAKRLLDLLDTGDAQEADAIVAFATATGADGKAAPFNASALSQPPHMTVGAVRLLHSMGLEPARIGAPDDLVDRSPDDFVTVSAQDAELARLLNLLEQAAADVESLADKLASEQAGLRAAMAAAAAAGNSGSIGGANGLMRQLGDSGVMELLEALKAAMAEAGAQRLTGLLDGAAGNRAWWMSPDAVQAEVGRLNAQAQRLAAGRKVLEAELERRASRDPAASSPGSASGSASGSAISSLETSVGVTVLKALLRADGSDAAIAAAGDEASLRALLAAGGGTLWHQAAELEEEARRVGTELAACKAEPSQFRPGCEPRLGFEEARLQEEASKRRAAASAERAVLEKLAVELTAALKRCRESQSQAQSGSSSSSSATSSEVEDDSGEVAVKAAKVADHFREMSGAPSADDSSASECAAVEQAGVSAQLRTVSAALEARRQVEEDWAQRTELQCLWRHRKLSLTELVAQSLAKAPAAESDPDADSASGEGPRLTRLLQVCAALHRPPLSGAEGAGVVEDCLCPEATSAHSLLVRARHEAASADAAKKAEEAARADAVADAAQTRASADDKEEEQVKTALFDYMRSRPEWSQMVSKAMAEEEAKGGPSDKH